MKRKLLKQISRQWRSNVWLVVELVIILVVTWFMVDLLSQVYVPYAEPTGFDISHCYKIKVAMSENPDTAVNVLAKKRELISRLRHYPGVEAVAVSVDGVEPYAGSYSSGVIMDVTTTDSVTYGFHECKSMRHGHINPDFVRVFRISDPAGVSPDSLARALESGHDRILLTVNFVELVDTAFRAPEPHSLVGHRFIHYGSSYTLAGVVSNVKRKDTSPADRYAALFLPFNENDDEAMRYFDNGTDVTIRVDPGSEKGFMERFSNDIRTHFNLGSIYVTQIIPFGEVAEASMADEFKAARKMYVVIGFLLVNVFLGLLGTFWYRTRQRTSELAVRMIFGASRISLFRRLMGEGLILLAVAAVIAGSLIAALLYLEIRPELTFASRIDIGWIVRDSVITFLLLLAMIFLGIWFPARAAMRVSPAAALHDE